MPAEDRVQLLDAKLELTRHLAPEERAELNAITLPAIDVPPGPIGLSALLRNHKAFAAGWGYQVSRLQTALIPSAMNLGGDGGLIRMKTDADSPKGADRDLR
jgi:hypothetical protein